MGQKMTHMGRKGSLGRRVLRKGQILTNQKIFTVQYSNNQTKNKHTSYFLNINHIMKIIILGYLKNKKNGKIISSQRAFSYGFIEAAKKYGGYATWVSEAIDEFTTGMGIQPGIGKT